MYLLWKSANTLEIHTLKLLLLHVRRNSTSFLYVKRLQIAPLMFDVFDVVVY